MPINVFLDTSVLPEAPGRFGIEFQYLTELSKERIIKVFLSDVVFKEWKSHFINDIAKGISGLSSSAKNSARNPWLKELTGDFLPKKEKELKIFDDKAAEFVEQKFNKIVEELNIEILPILESHGSKVMDDYFLGKSAFSSPKNKKNFPDAFIYHCAIDLQKSLNDTLHVIVNDRYFSDEISKIPFIRSHNSIISFVGSSELKNAVKKESLFLLWAVHSKPIQDLLSKHEDLLIYEFMESDLINIELRGLSVNHPAIPEDNHDAQITTLSKPFKCAFVWEKLKDLGPGNFLLPFECEGTVSLEFDVFKSDAYDVPNGVDVVIMDFESDDYFPALGEVKISVHGILSFQIPNLKIEDFYNNFDDLAMEIASEMNENIELFEFKSFEIEEIEKVNIVENSLGEIFL